MHYAVYLPLGVSLATLKTRSDSVVQRPHVLLFYVTCVHLTFLTRKWEACQLV